MDVASSASDVWDDDTWHRYGLLAGVVFVVLNIVSFIAAGSPPSRDASAADIAKYFVDNETGIKVGAIVFAISLLFGLWWIGSVWRVISRLEPSGPRLAVIAVLGFVMSGAMAAVAQAFFTAPALRIESLGATGEFVFVLGNVMFGMITVTTAGHTLALGALALWTKFVPVWLGYIAFVSAAAGLLGAGAAGSESGIWGIFAVVGFLLWLLWVLIASILLYRSSAK
jgi:hypothetical protein